jgi:hypothetical protein
MNAPAQKPRWRKKGAWVLAVYLTLPFLAGALGSDNPDGPLIYPTGLHALPYAAGRVLFLGKSPPKTGLYGRPLFYFMRREKQIFAPEAQDIPKYSWEF